VARVEQHALHEECRCCAQCELQLPSCILCCLLVYLLLLPCIMSHAQRLRHV
jgi:hypothetical protein